VNLLPYAVCSWLLVLPYASFSWGQPSPAPVKVSYCDLVTRPEQFAGKMVEVRATIVGYRAPSVEMPTFSPQEPCSAYLNIALEFPNDLASKPFDPVRDATYQEYQQGLQKPMRIEATLEGRFELVFVWKDRKRVKFGEGRGFGKKHSADARLVLRRMSDVVTRYLPRR
jgi:hypothetical protein